MRLSGLLLVPLVLLAAACQNPVKSQRHPALAERGPLLRIAVAPFQVSERLTQAPEAATDTPPHVAAALVARHLAEALEARGIEVIPADDVARALGEPDPEWAPAPRSLARVAFDRFGAQAVVVGVLHRYRARSGQAAGTLQPASVGFGVVLYGAPDGQELWRAVFDETQQALSENVFKAGRYPGGGSRWLSAEELARWGAQEVARALPAGG